ncbi:MAG: radical SAM protein [Anaerolineales bacterium]|nr:MAG: radical SAM protein [Anaerolineales bacterium]
MEVLEKLSRLAPPTRFEPCEDVTGTRRAPSPAEDACRYVHSAIMPGGKRIKLLKTLLSSACEKDCTYCGVRKGRDFRRATFTPDEIAGLFVQLHRKGIAEGIFLSSGVAGGGPRTQDRLLAAAELLRRRYGFRGYIHLKIMPGAERDQIAASMRLANRVSVNLEAPNPDRLAHLAPHKDFSDELLLRLRWIEEIRREEPGSWASSTTQFVVGAAGESDVEILSTTEFLHRRVGLARAYFSRFEPVPDTPLEHQPATPPAREHRLYQSSFLLRDYGFTVEELPFDARGNLPLETDPKLAWAKRNLSEAPVEINTADRQDLLRVPGIGPKGADRVLRARREGRLSDLAHLRGLGIAPRRASPYVLLDGRRPARQLELWPVGARPGA